MTRETEIEIATECAKIVRLHLVELHQLHGVSPEALLCGSLSQVAALMAVTMGPEMAAATLRQAAMQIENTPAPEDMRLAISEPFGHA